MISGAAFFLNADGKLEGIITDGDIRRILSSAKSAIIDEKVYPMINRRCVCVYEQDTVGKVVAVMENRDKPLNVVPVVDTKLILKGMIRIHDILK